MSGVRQNFIPRFVQKGCRIPGIGLERHFYAMKCESDLEDKITDQEQGVYAPLLYNLHAGNLSEVVVETFLSISREESSSGLAPRAPWKSIQFVLIGQSRKSIARLPRKRVCLLGENQALVGLRMKVEYSSKSSRVQSSRQRSFAKLQLSIFSKLWMHVLYCWWEFNGLQLWAIQLMNRSAYQVLLPGKLVALLGRQVLKRRFVTGQPKGGCVDGDATD